MSPKQRQKRARQQLVRSIAGYTAAFGRAQFMDGYRVKMDTDEMRQRSRALWALVGDKAAQRDRAIVAYTRSVAATARAKARSVKDQQ
jgi:hypothetical protein